MKQATERTQPGNAEGDSEIMAITSKLPVTVRLPPSEVARRSDGCTLAPDRWNGVDFSSACVSHDVSYYLGGTEEARAAADAQLARDMRQLGAPDGVASFYEGAVKLFGRGGAVHDVAVALGKDPFKWGYAETPRWQQYSEEYWRSQPASAHAAALVAQETQSQSGGGLTDGVKRLVSAEYDVSTNTLRYTVQLSDGASVPSAASLESTLRADGGAHGSLFQKGVAFVYEWLDATGKSLGTTALKNGEASGA